MFRFPCPFCGKRLKAQEDKVGVGVTCPKCGKSLQVPPPGPASPEQGPVRRAFREATWADAPPVRSKASLPEQSQPAFLLEINVENGSGATVVLTDISLEETVAAVILEVLIRLGLPLEVSEWRLELLGTALPSGALLRDHLSITSPAQLVLRRTTLSSETERLKRVDDASSSEFELTLDESEAGEESLESSDFDISLDEGPEAGEDSDSQVVALISDDEVDESRTCPISLHEGPAGETAPEEEEKAKLQTGASSNDKAKVKLDEMPAMRRATVRYYCRMNPERVYPLLVLITQDMVEKVRKKDTDQKSSAPFKVDAESPVEIEPVLPGCECHPPRMTVKIGRGDLTLTFRVVPRVLGRVDGAAVTIRQDHVPLAEIELDVKVTNHLWVVLSGAATFLLPGLSAILKHFGLDFETQKEQGFSLYLALARLLFDRISPAALTVLLGLGTALVWWLMRPRARDVFWKIEKVGPAEKLKRIAAAAPSAPEQASRDLLELLKAFPNYLPARLFYAEWHYNTKNYRASLKGYKRAFKLGVAEGRHYYKASIAADKLGENERALQILQAADEMLPAGEMTGTMIYNMGCYQARLGKGDEAMACLWRAVKAGWCNLASCRDDPDLAPLRDRDDFKQLVAFLSTTSRLFPPNP
jgi:hypothetical protein